MPGERPEPAPEPRRYLAGGGRPDAGRKPVGRPDAAAQQRHGTLRPAPADPPDTDPSEPALTV